MKKKKAAKTKSDDVCYTMPTEEWIKDVEDTLDRLNTETAEITEEEEDNRAIIGQLLLTQSTLIDIVYRLERELNGKLEKQGCVRNDYHPLKIVLTDSKSKINC